MKRLFVILCCMGLFAGVSAQERLTREAFFAPRRDGIMALPANPARISAVQNAKKLGIYDRRLYPDGRMVAIRRISYNGKPEFLTTFNLIAARTLSTDRVWMDGGSGLDLTGNGLVVGVWDAGVLRSTHHEFGERARVMNTDADVLGHPTHVSGTIGAEGFDGDARGMANQVIIEAYDWNNDLEEMDAAAGDGLLLSNHSYGYIVGFDYNSEERRWEWWGDTDISQEEDYLFGYYHSEARSYDRVAFDNPDYLIVKSAGNDRGEGPVPGSEHYVWDDGEWVASTRIRQIDGGDDGYGSIGPISTAKNILVVGAMKDLPDGVSDPEEIEITSYSVFGPTDDGRIKPDIVTNGAALYSSYTGSDSAYRKLSGTSMSAPGATGSMALLQEHHYNIYGSYLNASSMKALVLHTADDAGNPGPDYIYGWGLMNTAEAAKVISDTLKKQINEFDLSEGEELKIPFFCDGSQSIRATLCWTDPAGDVPAPSLNPRDRILINDLDIRIIRKIDGREYQAFILDPIHPSLAATKGDNIVDNVEQVEISAPEKGFYEIVVKHKGELSGDSQPFSLIISGLTDDYYASGNYHLRDNNAAFFLTSDSVYRPNMEATWLITPENKLPASLSFSYFETEENDVLRIYDGGDKNAPLLAEFSGVLSNSDTLITGSRDSLYLSFSSDEEVQGVGFEAQYCTTSPEGEFIVEGEAQPCTGTEEIYLASGQDGTMFLWTPPDGWDLRESTGNFAKLSIGSGNGLLELTPYNRCGESDKVDKVLESLSSTPHILSYSGDTISCSGEQGSLMVDSLAGASYHWMLPSNWQGYSETHKISFVPAPGQDVVQVSALNACGHGDTLEIATLVNSIPAKSEIYSVSDILCQYSPATFYLFAEDEVNYLWSVDDEWAINGDAEGDSLDVEIGANPGSIYVSASNECGERSSNRSFTLTDQPENPLLMESASIYDNLREIKVQNANFYTHIQWYLNGLLIDSPLATGSSYVAYVPGLYTVGVTGREGCTLIQESGDGISTSNPDNMYAVYAGTYGTLIINNATNAPATLNIFNMEGKLMLIQEIAPGLSELPCSLHGVQLISVSGTGNTQVFRIFLP